MQNLAPRQREVLDYITWFTMQHGKAPSRGEIGLHLGVNRSVAGCHVEALCRHGALCAEQRSGAIHLSGVDIDAVHYRLGAVRGAVEV